MAEPTMMAIAINIAVSLETVGSRSLSGIGGIIRPLYLAAALMLVSISAQAQTRGYTARACGFDMDDDGIVGEAVDDCNVCDGVTTDPDGDGFDEDLIYVHSATGVDVLSCGAPESPCASVTYAIETATASDGPSVGQEEIYCLAGTFAEENVDILFNGGGKAGTTSIPASGSQVRAWEKSTDPVMLIGWDVDNDGSYPPFDTDDTCVFDGSGTSLIRTFNLAKTADGSHGEIAHCTVRDYGADYAPMLDNGTGWLGGTQAIDHLSLHDLSLLNINRGRGGFSSMIGFRQFGGDWRWVEWRNSEILDFGAWMMRGAAFDGSFPEEDDEGPMRYQNLTSRGAACGSGTCDSARTFTGRIKNWGRYTGTEFLDSILDVNPDGTLGGGVPEGGVGLTVMACNQDYVIRNNEIIDAFVGVVVAPESNCSEDRARSITGVVIDRNYFHNEWDWNQLGEGAIQVLRGSTWAGETIEDVTVTNNVVTCAAPGFYEYFALDFNGHSVVTGGPSPTSLYDHNTWNCNATRDAIAVFNMGITSNSTHAAYTVTNNLVQGMESTDDVAATDAGSTTWTNNLYNNGDSIPAGWTQCTATFEADGFHLTAADTCAIDNASGSTVTTDIDGAGRPGGASNDVGADEEAGDEGEPPPDPDPPGTGGAVTLDGVALSGVSTGSGG